MNTTITQVRAKVAQFAAAVPVQHAASLSENKASNKLQCVSVADSQQRLNQASQSQVVLTPQRNRMQGGDAVNTAVDIQDILALAQGIDKQALVTALFNEAETICRANNGKAPTMSDLQYLLHYRDTLLVSENIDLYERQREMSDEDALNLGIELSKASSIREVQRVNKAVDDSDLAIADPVAVAVNGDQVNEPAQEHDTPDGGTVHLSQLSIDLSEDEDEEDEETKTQAPSGADSIQRHLDTASDNTDVQRTRRTTI